MPYINTVLTEIDCDLFCTCTPTEVQLFAGTCAIRIINTIGYNINLQLKVNQATSRKRHLIVIKKTTIHPSTDFTKETASIDVLKKRRGKYCTFYFGTLD